MIVMHLTAGRLMKNPGSVKHRLRGALVTSCIAKKARLELVGAEEPLHARLLVHDQGAHEVPVARFIEAIDATRKNGKAETIEARPIIAMRRHAVGVSREEQKIGIPPSAMRAMAGMRASARAR